MGKTGGSTSLSGHNLRNNSSSNNKGTTPCTCPANTVTTRTALVVEVMRMFRETNCRACRYPQNDQLEQDYHLQHCSMLKEFGLTVTYDPTTDQHRRREDNNNDDTQEEHHPSTEQAKKKAVTKNQEQKQADDDDTDGTSHRVGTASITSTPTSTTGARTNTGWKIV